MGHACAKDFFVVLAFLGTSHTQASDGRKFAARSVMMSHANLLGGDNIVCHRVRRLTSTDDSRYEEFTTKIQTKLGK